MKSIIKDRATPSHQSAFGSDPSQQFPFGFAPVPANFSHDAHERYIKFQQAWKSVAHYNCFRTNSAFCVSYFVPQNFPLALITRPWRLIVAADLGAATRPHTMGLRRWALCPAMEIGCAVVRCERRGDQPHGQGSENSGLNGELHVVD